ASGAQAPVGQRRAATLTAPADPSQVVANSRLCQERDATTVPNSCRGGTRSVGKHSSKGVGPVHGYRLIMKAGDARWTQSIVEQLAGTPRDARLIGEPTLD